MELLLGNRYRAVLDIFFTLILIFISNNEILFFLFQDGDRKFRQVLFVYPLASLGLQRMTWTSDLDLQIQESTLLIAVLYDIYYYSFLYLYFSKRTIPLLPISTLNIISWPQVCYPCSGTNNSFSSPTFSMSWRNNWIQNIFIELK